MVPRRRLPTTRLSRAGQLAFTVAMGATVAGGATACEARPSVRGDAPGTPSAAAASSAASAAPSPAPPAAPELVAAVAVYGAPITEVPVEVSFAPRSFALDARARTDLGFAAMFLKSPEWIVELQGHTDPEDGPGAARLAERRAAAVRAALIGLGVSRKQLRIGPPPADRREGASRAPSRRVEFITIARPYTSD